jgi:NitT/TauT family transport system permease protein
VQILGGIISTESGLRHFSGALVQTLFSSTSAFAVSYILALLLAVAARRFYNLRFVLAPFITVLRSAPTIAVILILLLTVPWSLITFVIAFLVIFPMLWTNLLAALDNVPVGELDAAKALGMRFCSRVRHVYLPSISHIMRSNVATAFGLGFKVVIAAEVLGRPINSLGYNISAAKSAFDYKLSWSYLIVSLLVAFAVERILAVVLRDRK